MTATVFVDTNVLIYALDQADLKKQAAAESWRTALWETQRGRISLQVLQEFYAKVIQKRPAAKNNARAEVLDLFAWRPLGMTTQLLELGWTMQDRFHLSFWDSLIVAAAKTCGCLYLLTEDLQAGQDFAGLKVISPFLTQPSALLQ
jgi:predicted nucleic acid-binding protein